MTDGRQYTQERYLAAKRTVDDRALDRLVFEAFEPLVDGSSRIVELGAGIGTMVQRLLEWEVLSDTVCYTLVDVDEDALRSGYSRLSTWGADQGYEVCDRDGSLVLETDDHRVTVRTIVADAREALEHLETDPDLIIGSAFVDLLRPPAVESLLERLPTGTVCYFPITFDGGTIFQPTAIPGFDEHVVERYHEDMLRREVPGDPHAGRHLLNTVRRDHTLIAAGASDWIVCPDSDGYPADEAYFLHHILHTVHGALVDDPAVDTEQLERWVARRHEQVERSELSYLTHQLDVLFRI